MSDFEKDSDCVAYALNLWANFIETGDLTLTHDDVVGHLKALESNDQTFSCRHERQTLFGKLKVLTGDQKAFVARLRELAKKHRTES
jgi:hypothetical protein